MFLDVFPTYAFFYIFSLMIVVMVFVFLGRRLMKRFDIATNRLTSGIQFGFFRKLKKNPIRIQDDLEFHELFIDIDFWLNYKINTMDFGSIQRNFIFRTLLMEKMKAVKIHTMAPLKDKRFDSMPTGEFKKMVVDTVTNINASFEDCVLDRYTEMYGDSSGKKMYDLVLHHPVKGFNKYHRPGMDYIKKLIERYSDSSVFKSNVERYKTILTAYYAVLDSTFVDVEDLYYKFNGDLDEVIKNIRPYRKKTDGRV